MTKFNPENKEQLTYSECLGPAMEITDQQDADQYFEAYVKFIDAALQKEPREDNMTAEQIAKVNIGYYAGYYGQETNERVQRLFKCQHPVFGSASKPVSAEEAFNKGVEMANS